MFYVVWGGLAGFIAVRATEGLPFGVALALIGAVVLAVNGGFYLLRRQRNRSRSGESAGQLREDGQVGMEPNPIKPTDAKRQ